MIFIHELIHCLVSRKHVTEPLNAKIKHVLQLKIKLIFIKC